MHMLFIDQDNCLTFKSETIALKHFQSRQLAGKFAILVSKRSNFYEIKNPMLIDKQTQVYSFNEVLKHIGNF